MVLPFKMNILDICHTISCLEKMRLKLWSKEIYFSSIDQRLEQRRYAAPKMSSVFTWLQHLKKKIVNTGCLYWVEKSCQRSLRASPRRKKETGRSTLLPQIIRRTYARSFSQLNMKQRQKAREELQQLRQLAKANTLL